IASLGLAWAETAGSFITSDSTPGEAESFRNAAPVCQDVSTTIRTDTPADLNLRCTDADPIALNVRNRGRCEEQEDVRSRRPDRGEAHRRVMLPLTVSATCHADQ